MKVYVEYILSRSLYNLALETLSGYWGSKHSSAVRLLMKYINRLAIK